MTNEIEQGLHEKLCAFVLGEASDEVRAEVEQALEGSAELREERERLVKTIGLVQSAMAGSESLPPSAAAEILADARRPQRGPWFARPAFRIAAGLAAVTIGGVIAFRAMMQAPRPRSIPELAVLERPASEGQENSEAPAKTELFASLEKKSPAAAAAESPVNHGTYHGPGDTLPAGNSNVTVRSLEQIDANQPAEVSVYDKVTAPVVVQGQKDRDGLGEMGYVDRSTAVQSSTAIGVGSGGAPAPSGHPALFARRASGEASAKNRPPATLPAAPYSGPVSRSDDFFLKAPAREEALGFRTLGYTGEDDVAGVRLSDLSVLDQLRRLDPPDREKWIEGECQRIVTYCRRRPNERPRDMFFRFYGDNPFEIALVDPQSTFSVDVDTASYTLARRYLNEGHIPEKAQVRTEEFVNYFKADVPAPTKGTFAIHTDLAPSRYSSDMPRSMLRVVVRGREVVKEQRQPLNLTFVIDVSGSMREQNRLEMVKHAIRLLVGELGNGDNIAIVVFSNDARLVLPMTSVRNRSAIETALEPLQPENSTNSESGLKLGYATALTNINPEAQNRVVFLSDGVANVGETDPAKLSESIKPIREKGIYLNTIGVGMNNHNDTLLDQLADKGDGVSSYIDTPDEARKVIVDGFTGAFETIARDVKIQVEFDPAQVERYRLLGYESRAIADKDFRNDKVDAGEVGAGHQVTALYEIERAAGASDRPLATVRLRWKAPRKINAPTASEEATEIAEPVLAGRQTSFEGAGPGYRRAVIVAQFAEFLRRSVHARGDSLDGLIKDVEDLAKETSDPEVGELVVLMHKSRQLILNALPPCDDLCRTIDAVRRNELLRAEREMLTKEVDGKLLTDLEKQNADLEKQIRDLLRRKLERQVK